MLDLKIFDKLGVQAFTVRDFMQNEADIAETFCKLKALGYDQVQTARCAVPYEVYGELADKAGIEIVGTHDSFALMCDDFEQALANHKALGTLNMGIGGMFFQEEPVTPEQVEDFIAKANAVGANAAKYGGKFTYHNHAHEFVRLSNGRTIMDMLTEGLDPKVTSFVLDTFWVQRGGGEPSDWIEKLSGRIDILHLKDMLIEQGTKEMKITEIGNGNLNWERILTTAARCGVKYYVVEEDFCPGDPFDSLKISSDYIHKNFM